MKEFWDKKQLNKSFLPDFLLALILLCVAIRFSSEIPTWFDIPQSDDNVYMAGGIHFGEMFDAVNFNVDSDWSPLYQFWFFVIYQLVPDSTKIYYISMWLLGILIPLFSFILLRRIQVPRWLAALTSAFFLASYAVWMVEPRVTSFATLVLLVLWWVTSLIKERWRRLFGMAAGSLLIAYSRPEFFLITLLLSVLALGYLGYLLLRQKLKFRLSGNFRGRYPDLGVRACVRTLAPPNPASFTGNPKEPKFDRADLVFLGFIIGVPLLLLIIWGIPFSSGRSIYAFGQHYAKNAYNCFTENTSSDMAWEEILARDFGKAQNMEEVVRANPLSFGKHLACNIRALPNQFLKVGFSSAWGSSWLIIRVWIAFIVFRLATSWDEIKSRFIWLWKQDFLLLGFLSLGILLIDVILIYPREHYLVLFSIIAWILGISLFAGFTASEQKGLIQSIAIGLCLLLLTPSMGVLFDFRVPQKPVLKTVEALRALDFDEPIRLFATHPFRRSQSEIYFDENYYHIAYKPAEISFDEYISTNQANVIVITQGGQDLKGDASWAAFEANPQAFGFNQIPFEEGDQRGPWRIYIKD